MTRREPGRAVIEIGVLGRIAVSSGARTLGPRDFGGVKPKQVFEILLLHGGQPVPKERLTEQLWGESLPQNPTGALETYVSVLRRRLSSIGIPAAALVVTEPEAYRLALDLVDLDAHRFDNLVERAAAAGPREARALLERALSIVRGDLLEDEPYADWVLRERDIRRRRIVDATLDAAVAALADGAPGAALEHARDVLSRDEFSERGHQLVMLSQYALGQQHAALQAYDACRTLLEEELGLDPMPQTRELRTAILRQVDPAELLPDRLRTTRSTVSRAPSRGDLIGRHEELALASSTLATALSDGGPAMVVIEGPDGVGKSRLLAQLCEDARGVTVARAVCSPLERELPYATLALALRGIAGREGSDGRAVPRPALYDLHGGDGEVPAARVADALAEALRGAGPVLLALDDVHHADPQTLAAISTLLRWEPADRVAVVVTVDPESPVAGTLVALRAGPRIVLGPLGRDELAGEGLGDLYEATGGFPALVERLRTAAGAAEAAAAVEESLALVRGLGPFAVGVAVALGVVGDTTDVEQIAAVVDAGEAETIAMLDRLVARHVLAAGSYESRVGLLREALAASVSPAQRNLLERRAAAFLAARAAGSVTPVRAVRGSRRIITAPAG